MSSARELTVASLEVAPLLRPVRPRVAGFWICGLHGDFFFLVFVLPRDDGIVKRLACLGKWRMQRFWQKMHGWFGKSYLFSRGFAANQVSILYGSG